MDVIESRLYYQDAYLTEFDAHIVEQFPLKEAWGVILDRSAFYPTSGGQTHDTGTLNGVAVSEVFEREDDRIVVHVVSQKLDTDVVHGQVDWVRRFDHMQQHTGQHVLSHALEALLDAETVGFHLSDDVLTIDIAHTPLSLEDWHAVEDRANAIVFADLPVEAQFVGQEGVSQLSLRKQPTVSGPVRVVQTGDLDYSPCGGTHCRSTGSVGLILIRKVERKGPETRIDFVCGGRALVDCRRKNRLVNEVSSQLSVGEGELADAVARAQEEIKSCHRRLKQADDRLLGYEAEELLAQAETIGNVRVIKAILADESPASAKHLAIRLMDRPSCAVLLARVQDNSVQLTFARSDNVPADMRPLLKDACRIVGGGGGGQPNMAQGGGSRVEQVDSALDSAVQSLKALLSQL